MKILSRALILITAHSMVLPFFAAESVPAPIEAFVKEALSGNPELKFYEAEIAVAKGERRAAGAWQNPEISTKTGAKNVHSLSGQPTGDGLAWQVTMSQTFEFPGRLSLRKAIANQQIQLSELGLEQFRAALSMRVRLLAFKRLAAQERAEAARTVADRFQDVLSVLVQRDPAGVAPMLATRIIEASGLTVNRRAAEASRELFNAGIELNQLRGLPVVATVSVQRTPMVLQPAAALEKLLSSARINNFEIRARAAELEQQGFRVRLSENEKWPAITLMPYAAGERTADRQREYGIGLSIPLPIINRNQGNIAANQARLEQAEVSLKVAIRDMERKVASAANAYELQLKAMERWPEGGVAKIAEAAKLADQHYRLGAVPISTYVELQIQYLDAVDAVLATQLEAMEARQQVEILAGISMEGTALLYRETLPVIPSDPADRAGKLSVR
jgi:cobalt-zinc-cadmium efflux system outer membrane protein